MAILSCGASTVPASVFLLLQSFTAKMSIDETTPPAPIVLKVEPDEAQMIVEALKMLANSRRFAFKEREANVNVLYRRLFETVQRIEAQVKERLDEA